MHRECSNYALTHALRCGVTRQPLLPQIGPHSTRRLIWTNHDGQDENITKVTTHASSPDVSPNDTNDAPVSGGGLGEKENPWRHTWANRGNKHFSPVFAQHVIPLLEATPDDPLEDEIPSQLREVLNTNQQPLRRRNYRNLPRRRGVLPRAFRKAQMKFDTTKEQGVVVGKYRSTRYSRRELPTERLEQELKTVAHRMPHPASIERILTILIKDRHVTPSSRHYEAMILANCHPELGSVENVMSILQMMAREKVAIDAPTSFAVLKVLSVHPDSLLRVHFTTLLEAQWVKIPADLAQLVIVAMIREGQLALARIEIDRLNRIGTMVSTWVWIILIHALCAQCDFETILQLFRDLPSNSHFIPRPTLLHVLQNACLKRENDLTKYIWHTHVESMHIIPDEALCIEVMRTAAQHHDLKLAESVAIVLESVTTSTADSSSAFQSTSDLPDSRTSQKSNVDESANSSGSRKSAFSAQHSMSKSTASIPISELQTTLEVVSEPAKSQNSDSGLSAQALPSQQPAGEQMQAFLNRNDQDSPEDSKHPLMGITLESTHHHSKMQCSLHPVSDSDLSTKTRDASHQIPPPRAIPAEAQSLLASVRAHYNKTEQASENRRGNFFPLFREEMGLRDARFDPRSALRKPFWWWLVPRSSKENKSTN